jgi:hypothetical protein
MLKIKSTSFCKIFGAEDEKRIESKRGKHLLTAGI